LREGLSIIAANDNLVNASPPELTPSQLARLLPIAAPIV
jgi:hypothetical protein